MMISGVSGKPLFVLGIEVTYLKVKTMKLFKNVLSLFIKRLRRVRWTIATSNVCELAETSVLIVSI